MRTFWPSTSTAPQHPHAQQRLLLGICVGLLVIVGVSLALAAREFEHSFNDIEVGATMQKARQLNRLLADEQQQLEFSLSEYAVWEDAAKFIASRDPRFVRSNFTPEALAGIRVDLVWVVDKDGQDRYSGLLDAHDGRIQSPAPPPMLRRFRQAMTATTSGQPPAGRLVRLESGLAAYAVQDIKPGGIAPSTGSHMLFARFIDAGGSVDAIARCARHAGRADRPARRLLTPAWHGHPAARGEPLDQRAGRGSGDGAHRLGRHHDRLCAGARPRRQAGGAVRDQRAA
jgi:hypothetical protein